MVNRSIPLQPKRPYFKIEEFKQIVERVGKLAINESQSVVVNLTLPSRSLHANESIKIEVLLLKHQLSRQIPHPIPLTNRDACGSFLE